MFLFYNNTLTATLSSPPTTTAPTYVSHVVNNGGPTITNGVLSASATTIATGVSSAVASQVSYFHIYNADSVSATVTVSSVVQGTTTIVGVWTLSVGDTLEYVMGQGWRQLTNTGQLKTSGTFPAGNVTMTGLLYETYQDNITAKAGGGQGSATQLSAEINRIGTVASAADSVALPAATPGLTILVINHGANPCQVFGSGTDTINDVATATGVSQMVNSTVLYISTGSGKWYSEGLATGYSTSGALQTLSFANTITAFAGGGQGSATALTAMMNRVTTVATAGDSVRLPASVPGAVVYIDNRGANPLQVFGASTDTINGVATATGVPQGVNTIVAYNCWAAGNWETSFGGSVQSSVLALSASGAIPPHTPATYVLTKAGVAAMTLAAPTATTDDGVIITVTSNTANAHTITATGLLQTGSASVNVATFAANACASITLMAYQAKWNVLNSVGITFS